MASAFTKLELLRFALYHRRRWWRGSSTIAVRGLLIVVRLDDRHTLEHRKRSPGRGVEGEAISPAKSNRAVSKIEAHAQIQINRVEPLQAWRSSPNIDRAGHFREQLDVFVERERCACI